MCSSASATASPTTLSSLAPASDAHSIAATWQTTVLAASNTIMAGQAVQVTAVPTVHDAGPLASSSSDGISGATASNQTSHL